jgi:phasin family protein
MRTAANPLSDITAATVDSAAKLTRISMDSAERVLALQLDFAKASLGEATRGAKAIAGAKDVQELLTARTRTAETAVERLMGYSRGLYQISAEAQAQLSRLAEERMSSFQQAVSETVEQAAKSAPGGSDAAVAAIKSSLAATTAAFDTFNKAARQLATYSEAGVNAATSGRKPRAK